MKDLSIVKINNLVLVSIDDLRKSLGEDVAEEIIETTPVIEKFGQKYVRAAEIDDLSHLAIDEETAQYDLFDLYCQSSNHVLAAISVLKLFNRSVDDLSDKAKSVMNKIYLDDQKELKVLRKEVIEHVLESLEERKSK